MALRARVDAWFRALPEDRLRAIAASVSEGLIADGLTVFDAAHDRFVPIPAMLTPRIVDDATFAAFAADARILLEAAVRAARYTLVDAPERGRRLYATLTPLEHAALRDPSRLSRIATARVDAFGDPASAQVLELNATIPAMQGYSDMALHRWLRAIADERGEDGEALVRAAGSNTDDLLASLVAHWREESGRDGLPRIAIVSRRGDSQLGELRWYERRWTAAGAPSMHVWADEIGVVDGELIARGERFDLLYRHIFARRVDEASPLGALLAHPRGVVVRNPVASPLEVKGLLGVLHEAVSDDGLAERMGLTATQRGAIARRVPWTRLLTPGPATLADGTRIADLPRWVAANRDSLVVKRSWDYGGKAVVLGPEADGEAARRAMSGAYGGEVHDWSGLVARASADDNAWVVQGYVRPVPESHLLCAETPRWTDVYVDLNAYTALGDVVPRGGVCRASGSKIVNILGGGGITPLLRASIAEKLFSAGRTATAADPAVRTS